MENFDYTKELEAVKLEIAAILNSDNTPEHKYIALLLLDFDSAHQICLSAADGQSLNIRYLLTFFLAKNAMYGPMVDGANFDTWPKMPGIRFNHFTRQSAKDLAWAFTAEVHEQFSSDPTNISFRLVDQSPPVCKTELQNWLDSVFSRLPNKLDISDPERFNDDAKWLVNAVIDEKKVFFASPKESIRTADRNHSEDFCSVWWDGNHFEFTKSQAAAIKLLWSEYEKGTWVLGQETIGDKIGSSTEKYRLVQTFEKGKHPAWGTLIIPGQKKGTFRLADKIQKKQTGKKKFVKK